VKPKIDGRSVILHEPVGGEKRSVILGRAHALLHLINFEEPFGLSVVEAMACGTPVIATRRGSMSEIIKHGRTGFIVDSPQQAVAAVEAVAAIVRQKPRELVTQRFAVERMARDYVKLYERILDTS